MGSTKDFNAGIPEIDQQNRILMDCISLIEEAVSKKTPRSAIQPLLGQVVHFAQLHFDCEESAMRNYQYPGLEKHAEEHLQFMSNLRDLQERLQGDDVANEAIFFIENRLLEHSMGSDRQYGSWLTEAGERGEGGDVFDAG